MKDIIVVQAGHNPLEMIVGKFDKVEDARKFISGIKENGNIYHILKLVDSVRIKVEKRFVVESEQVELDIVDPESLLAKAKKQTEDRFNDYFKPPSKPEPMSTDMSTPIVHPDSEPDGGGE
jgi:hypothetical protein